MNNELEGLLVENGLDPEKIREDYFIDPECRILQSKQHFCFNSDSTDLARLCRVYPHDRVCEIGTNNGALLVYLDRFQPDFLCGIEILQEPAKLARLNLDRSVLCKHKIFVGSVESFPEGQFDLVLCNPPYFELPKDQNFVSELSLRQQARFEKNLDLKTMIVQASRLLRSNGRFCFVHRPERIAQAIVELDAANFSISRLQIAYDKRDGQAKAILIEAIKEGNCRPQILGPIFRE